jgi:serine/threonine protein kinase
LNHKLRQSRSTSRYVVKLVEVLEEKDFTYLVTAWMPLSNLQNKIERGLDKYLVESEICVPLMQVAAALQHIHSLGFTHNGVKPENIFLDQKDRVKLGGFSQVARVQTNLIKGVEISHYSAPELCGSTPTTPTPSSDIYSLGVTLYALACGKFPFSSKQ